MIEYRKAGIEKIEELFQVRIDFLWDAKNITTNEEEKIVAQAYREFLNEVLKDGSFIQWLALEFGYKLLTLAVEEAKNHGCEKVLLNATEMGRPLYLKFGFTNTTDEMVYRIT